MSAAREIENVYEIWDTQTIKHQWSKGMKDIRLGDAVGLCLWLLQITSTKCSDAASRVQINVKESEQTNYLNTWKWVKRQMHGSPLLSLLFQKNRDWYLLNHPNRCQAPGWNMLDITLIIVYDGVNRDVKNYQIKAEASFSVNTNFGQDSTAQNCMQGF